MMEHKYAPKANWSAGQPQDDQAVETGKAQNYPEMSDAGATAYDSSVVDDASETKGFRFTVGRKLLAGFGLLTVIFIAFGFLTLKEVSRIKFNLLEMTNMALPLHEAAYEMESSSLLIGFEMMGLLRDSHDAAFLQKFQEGLRQFQEAVEAYAKYAKTETQKKLAVKVREQFGRMKNAAERVVLFNENESKKEEECLREADRIRDILSRDVLRPEEAGYQEKLVTILEIQLNKNRSEKYLELFITENEPAFEDQMKMWRDRMRQELEKFKAMNLSAREQQWAAEFLGPLNSLSEKMDVLITDVKEEQRTLEEYRVARMELETLLNNEVLTDSAREMDEHTKGVKDAVVHTKSVTVAALLLVVLLSVIAALMIARSIINPLKLVMGSMDAIGREGDLTREARIQSSDEMGVLSRVLNFMRKNVANIVTRIHQASLKINSTSNQILAASTQHEATSNEQATQMQEIQATLNQAAATVTELDQNSKEILKFSKEIVNQAEEGTQFIGDTSLKIKAMNESNKTVGNKLRILNEKIEGIGKILTTILSVADQTNLLSLNAAIEAAKAGEHGKGFSVVAQEIRRLADQTAQSSQEISKIVNEVQAASSSAIMGMDKSAQDVAESTRVVGDLSERFSGISSNVQNILPQLESMTQGITEFAAGNKETLAAVSEMGKALKLTADAAKQLRQAAYDLTAMGQQLRGAVGQFKLK